MSGLAADVASASATPTAASLRAYYDYDRIPVEAVIRRLPSDEPWELSEISFPSPVSTPYPANNTVYGRYYRPRACQPVPAVIVLHEWGAVGRSALAETLCRELARRGLAALLVTLPYQLQRTPPGFVSGRLMITGDPVQVEANVRQAVLDVRRAADWLQERPEVDRDRLGIAGISLGATIGDLSMGVDDRFSACASILGAGDLAKVYWDSPLLWRRQRKAKELGFTYPEVRRLFEPIEPAAFAGRVARWQILMINALHDFVLPRSCIIRLWEAYGRPTLLWVDAGHYGAFLAEHAIFRRAGEFLEARLNGDRAPLHLTDPRVPVRVRFGLYELERRGLSPALSLGLAAWGDEGQYSVELLVSKIAPVLSLCYAMTENTCVGWGMSVAGGHSSTIYFGLFATL